MAQRSQAKLCGWGKERIDVENPAPGKRAGQIHYQENNNNKYYYDPITQSFPGAPKGINDKLSDPTFKNAINKGMKKIFGGEVMLTNQLMRSQLRFARWEDIKTIGLSSELNEIVTQGFVELEGCFLSKKLLSYCQSSSPDVFEDEIAFECFVNSIHMDDYVNDNYLEYSVVFTNFMIKKWNQQYDKKLNFIISLDDETLLPTIKFHLKRDGVSWLNEDDLDESIQAVLITTDEIYFNDD